MVKVVRSFARQRMSLYKEFNPVYQNTMIMINDENNPVRKNANNI